MGNSAKKTYENLLAEKEFIILDGASGTEFQKCGLKPGEHPERLNFSEPNLVVATHKAYLEAGADIILSNTFGASYNKLQATDLEPETAIVKGIDLAKLAIAEYQASKGQKQRQLLVAFDCGPLGSLIEPNGTLSYEQAYLDFSRQIKLADNSGADLIMFETMSDLYELKIALLAAKENSDLPIICSMSFEEDGRTFSGTDVLSYVTLAQSLEADVIGLNCSTGPQQLLPLIEEILQLSKVPVLLKPNAGLPDPRTGLYDLPREEFAETMRLAAKKGVKFLGGCCGTSSEYIKALIDKLSGVKFKKTDPIKKSFVSSATKTVAIGETPLLVGEQLNPTGKKILKQALQEKDYQVYQKLAINQEAAGADILDINCGLPGIDETEAMIEVVKKVQAVTRLPLQIDSDKPEVLQAGLRFANGRCIINSMNGKETSLAKIIPLAKQYGAMVIILPIDEQGIAKTAEQRIAIFKQIIERSLKEGLAKEDLIADCLVLTAAAEPAGATECLRTIKMVKDELGLATIVGLSNISFGLPARRQLNQVFYAEALANGLDLAILNPEHQEMVATRASHLVLSGQDPNQSNYIAYTKQKGDLFSVTKQQTELQKDQSSDDISAAQTIEQAILQGLEKDAKQLATKSLVTMEPLDIIQNLIIPALDEVGRLYQTGVTFLPQLLQSSKAAQSALLPIRKAIEKEISANPQQQLKTKKSIVVATVEGDIHDIGKNIIKTVLENYDYHIIDLGNDVSPEKILETVKDEQIKLVGLSALMTSTLPAMEKTIKLLNKEQPDCKIMVGGAVLTAEYAVAIGADYYCLNAKNNVDVAREVFS